MALTNDQLQLQPMQIPSFNLPSTFNAPGQSFLDTQSTNVNTGFNAGVNPVTPGGIPSFSLPGSTPGGAGAQPGFFSEAGGSRFLVPGLEALTGLGTAFLAKNQLDLGEDQFDFARSANIRDFNTQAQVFNTNLENDRRRSLVSSGGFDTSTPEGQAQFDQALQEYVDRNQISPTT